MTRIASLLLACLVVGCGGSGPTPPLPIPGELPAGSDPASALLVTRLGDDTVAVERIHRNPSRYWATVLLRSPRTTLRVYRLHFDSTGQPETMVVTDFDPAAGPGQEPLETTEVDLSRGSGIPFIEMAHWPFELMIERAAAAPTDTITLALIAGDRLIPFRMERLGGARFTATHPTRGTMTIQADAEGRLLSLDASRTTRALRIARQADDEIFPIANDFATRPMGELSGRGEAGATIDGADIAVDYGVPMKRGREIFGALVPWDRVWRTGANRATHFSTTRDLRIGDADIPAGSYTLFTIPRADGWTLIVNRNIDINGQAYEEAADLLRVEMEVRTLDRTVEPFTILVEPTGDGGLLRMQWDRTEARLPFEVVR